MQITYDPNFGEFVTEDGETVREFFINERQKTGIKHGTIETMLGLTHPSVLALERPTKGKKPSLALLPTLAALEV